jgi:hypothetical protein
MRSHRSYLNQTAGLRAQYETLNKKSSTSPDTKMKMLNQLISLYTRLSQFKTADYLLNILEELCSTHYPYSARHLHVKSLIVMNENKVIKEKINKKKNKVRTKNMQEKAYEKNQKELLKKGKKSENNDENEKEA